MSELNEKKQPLNAKETAHRTLDRYLYFTQVSVAVKQMQLWSGMCRCEPFLFLSFVPLFTEKLLGDAWR